MLIDRRTFLETPIWAAGLALSPSFNHLLGATHQNENPHRFIFVRKSNGNEPALFSLPTFSPQEQEKVVTPCPSVAHTHKHTHTL